MRLTRFVLILRKETEMRALFASFGFILIASICSADPVSLNRQPRGMMMGNAGLALEGSRDSAVMNPAGLADIQRSEWQFPFIFELPFQIGTFREGMDYNSVRKDDSATEAEKQEALEKFFGKAASDSVRARANFYPSYTRRNLHIGFFGDVEFDTDFRLGGFTSNQLMEAGDTAITAGILVGVSHSFLKNHLQVGATVKPLYRISPFNEQTQRLDSILVGLNSGEDVGDKLFGDSFTSGRGFAFGVDLGLKYWFQEELVEGTMFHEWVQRLRPAFGLTYQDVGNTRFFRREGENVPEDITQSISVGMAFHPKWSFVTSRFALDIRDINQSKAFLNRIHLGWESVLWNLWALRVGVSQGYLTGGMGVDLYFVQLDVFVSAEEAGQHARLYDKRTIGLRLSGTF